MKSYQEMLASYRKRQQSTVVDTIAAGGQSHRQQGILVQVAVRGPGGADADGLGGQLDMEGLRIRLGIGGHGLDIQLPAGPLDPQGDLAPVGDQHPLQHGRYRISGSP